MNKSLVQYKLKRLEMTLKKMTNVDFALFYVLVEKERTRREIDNEIADIKQICESVD